MIRKRGWTAVTLLGVLCAAGLGWQYKTSIELRQKLVQAKQRPRTAQVAGPTQRESALETTAASAVADELQQAQQEATSLHRQVELEKRQATEREAEKRFAPGSVMAAVDWANAGNTTVKAALETVLWAGAAGDVNALAQSFHLVNPATRVAAEKLLEGLPSSLRETLHSPEQMLAFLTVKDIPLGAAEVRRYRDIDDWPNPTRSVNLLLTSADGKQKEAMLLFTNAGSGWKLVVTDSVVAHYATALKAPTATKDK